MYNLWIVIPCFQEETVLPKTAEALLEELTSLIKKGRISSCSRVLFVDDCSKDLTWKVITSLHNDNPCFTGIRLSHNRGQQKALLAGLMQAKDYADLVISMDADLQDDISILEQFIDRYEEGCEVVYGVRSSRIKDSFFKRFSAKCFYQSMKLLGAEVVSNHAEYRLLSKKALMALSEYDEANIFLRGIIPEMGFRSGAVYYERNKRIAGKTKYSIRKMLGLAFDGVTSFSIKPIRFVFDLGLIIFLISLFVLLWAFIQKLLGNTVSGWTSLVASIWLLGGIQLLSIGIIGEYIGKIYSETKHRPKYFIEDTLINDSSDRREATVAEDDSNCR